MLNNIYREKILNAILHIAKNVKYPFKLKIFKLLYFLDFQHIKEKGRPVTNLEYYAWEKGPVPKSLQDEFANNNVPEDFKDFLKITPIKTDYDKNAYKFTALKNPNLDVFSPREKRILDDLIFIFKDIQAEEMSEISHLKNKPWDKTLKEKGLYELIDYLYSIDEDAKIDKEEAEERLNEREEMLNNYLISNHK